MKTPALFFALFIVGAAAQGQEASRQRLSADFHWLFSRGELNGAERAGFDDSAWRQLDLPHDWSIEGPFGESEPAGGGGGYLPTGVGWYRRHFVAPESWRGKKVLVEFDGVYQRSEVWINGHRLGLRPFGYLGFEYELSSQVKFGATNVLAVRVDNSLQPNSRWYSGSGIYRHVWFTIADPVHVAHWGTVVTTPRGGTNAATVRIRTRVQNELREQRRVTLTSRVLNAAGTVVATAESTETVPAGNAREFDQSVDVPQPALWSLESPN